MDVAMLALSKAANRPVRGRRPHDTRYNKAGTMHLAEVTPSYATSFI